MMTKIYGLLNYCYEDCKDDQVPGIELQLFLIAVKSLLPYEDKIGCLFDVKRYEREIQLFKYYKNGNDDSIEYYYENKKPSKNEDRLLEFKIIPVIVANTQWDNLINEALRAAIFYSVNKNTILDTIIIASAVDEYLSTSTKDMGKISELAKERLINFSIKEFLNSNNIELNKESLIGFEKERINMLSNMELMYNLKNKYKSLNYIYKEQKTDKSEINGNTVLSSFSLYLSKLRQGVIGPERLKVPQGNIPELREFLKHSSFVHPLLGRCKIIKRGVKEVIIKNKTGIIKVNI